MTSSNSSRYLDLLVCASEGRLSFDLQRDAVCTKVTSDTKRIRAKSCSDITVECNSVCALAKSKAEAVASYFQQYFEAYPSAVAGLKSKVDTCLNDIVPSRWEKGLSNE